MTDEIEEKTERIVEMLAREKLGGVIINGQHNFAWLTGGGSNGVDLSRENGAASILVRGDGKRFVLANNIEMPRLLAEEISASEFDPIEIAWQDEKATSDNVIERARRLLPDNAVLVSDIPLHLGTRAIDGMIAQCRYSLTESEIERYRELGVDAGSAMRAVIDKLNTGDTELEVAAKMRSELWSHGINSVMTLVAADDRISKYRHPLPTENRWRKMLLLVTCAKRHGLIVSLSRIFCAGRAPDELTKKTEAAAYVNARLMAATQPHATGADLYHIAARAYMEKGFAGEIDCHHQGGSSRLSNA